jgi:galactoside O-acetyltransferase
MRDLGPGVTAYDGARIIGSENIVFGAPVLIDDFALIIARDPIIIGDYVHIACFSSITGGERVEIGDYCAVSQGARLLTGTDDFIHGGFGNSTVPPEYRNARRAPIQLGRFCIVGANAVVLPGVSIGEGAVVGANSVVTRDLDPWGVYIGNRRHRERNKEAVLANARRFEESTASAPSPESGTEFPS